MYLKIISLKGIEYENNIASLNIKTQSGEITVLENHRPLITLLKKGLATIIDQQKQKKEIEINSGFLEVTPQNKINVLID